MQVTLNIATKEAATKDQQGDIEEYAVTLSGYIQKCTEDFRWWRCRRKLLERGHPDELLIFTGKYHNWFGKVVDYSYNFSTPKKAETAECEVITKETFKIDNLYATAPTPALYKEHPSASAVGGHYFSSA